MTARTPRTVRMLAVATGLLLALGACSDPAPHVSGGAGSSTGGASTSASSSTFTSAPTSASSSPSSTAAPTSAASRYAIGDCLSSDYTAIECSRDHFYEVTGYVDDGQSFNDRREQKRAYECDRAAVQYLAGPILGSRFLAQLVPEKQNPANDTQAVCVIVLQMADDSGLEPIAGSSKQILRTRGLSPYRLCTTAPPSQGQLVATDCSKPHVAESVGGFLTEPFGAPYPDAAKQLAACRSMARKYLGGDRPDVVPAQFTTGRGVWLDGQQRTACFVETRGGVRVNGSLEGLGSKPLPKAS